MYYFLLYFIECWRRYSFGCSDPGTKQRSCCYFGFFRYVFWWNVFYSCDKWKYKRKNWLLFKWGKFFFIFFFFKSRLALNLIFLSFFIAILYRDNQVELSRKICSSSGCEFLDLKFNFERTFLTFFTFFK